MDTCYLRETFRNDSFKGVCQGESPILIKRVMNE